MIKSEKLELVDIDKLVPYARNARTHSAEQIKQLQASMREFGFVNPVLIDEAFNIIAGHGRILAAKEEGIETVPCVKVEHLTEAQKKAYILADNKLAMNAGWDMDMLKIEIEELQDLDFELGLIGFSDEEMDGLLNPDQPVIIVEDDFDITPPEEPKSKLGELYQLGRHRLLCGDSTSIVDVERLIDGTKMDMVFTDPPWNVNYGAMKEDNAQGYKPRTILNDFMGTEDFKEFMLAVFNCMNVASKPGAITYVVMSAQEWGNMMLALCTNGYHWSSTIIWNKDHLVLSRKDYHTKYEPIWYGWKEGEARLHPLPDRKQSDVWDIDRPTKSELHPTTKPVELVVRAIENSSNQGDSVLDLFGGSGTSLIAAEETHRSCFMMELDPKYVDVIVNRWESLTNKKAVLLDGNNA